MNVFQYTSPTAPSSVVKGNYQENKLSCTNLVTPCAQHSFYRNNICPFIPAEDLCNLAALLVFCPVSCPIKPKQNQKEIF